jgi:hypothetical protein
MCENCCFWFVLFFRCSLSEGEDKKKSLISDVAKDLENGVSGTKQADKAEAGTAEYLIQLEERRSIKVSVRPSIQYSSILMGINTDDLI